MQQAGCEVEAAETLRWSHTAVAAVAVAAAETGQRQWRLPHCPGQAWLEIEVEDEVKREVVLAMDQARHLARTRLGSARGGVSVDASSIGHGSCPHSDGQIIEA